MKTSTKIILMSVVIILSPMVIAVYCLITGVALPFGGSIEQEGCYSLTILSGALIGGIITTKKKE
jgi:hypothetical protein